MDSHGHLTTYLLSRRDLSVNFAADTNVFIFAIILHICCNGQIPLNVKRNTY